MSSLNHILEDSGSLYGLCTECGEHGSTDGICEGIWWCSHCDEYHYNTQECPCWTFNNEKGVWEQI